MFIYQILKTWQQKLNNMTRHRRIKSDTERKLSSHQNTKYFFLAVPRIGQQMVVKASRMAHFWLLLSSAASTWAEAGGVEPCGPVSTVSAGTGRTVPGRRFWFPHTHRASAAETKTARI